MFAGTYFAGAVFGGLLGIQGALPAIDVTPGIAIGGVSVTGRVRVDGVTIHDILNDAPNTCVFTIEGAAPVVGQRVRVTLGNRVLFAGSVQTVDQAYESTPDHLAWHVTAIDDTAAANARRPFGTYLAVSATTIAQQMTATYAPTFSPAGIEAGLPAVTIIFDGADTFIACLARLATAVGGYAKVDDQVVYLFTEDTADPPNPINDAHRFLMSPPIQMTTDVSQLRTRVYGKGYGESVTADLDPGETLLPIQDGVMFPPLGGTAIAGLTADGAQSEVVDFTGTVLASGGSLVGTGASPSTAPILELKAGAGVTPGLHTLSVAFRTAAGVSMAGPPGSITTGTHPPPATAPTAGTATNGTGPDLGSHDYAASFVTAYGETLIGAISNSVTTSSASGQVEAPGPCTVAVFPLVAGNLGPGQYRYGVSFTTATGETDVYWVTSTTTSETGFQMHLSNIDLGPPGVTGRKVYRNERLLVTLGNNLITTYEDNIADNSGGALMPVTNTTGTAVQRVPLTNIPIGPVGVTARKLYRRFNGAGTFKLVTTLANNTTTTYTDSTTNAGLGAAALGTATAVGNQIGIKLPIGPAAVTARELYMSPVGGTPRRLLWTQPDNTLVDLTAISPDSALTGALEPTADTSGLQQPQGQVNPGSTVLPVASPAPFRPSGGWVVLGGGQVVKHTGISGNTLTGIPASGSGAIHTTVTYGSQAIPSPMLVGVSGLTRPMQKGAAVHIWVQRDDLLAQADHAARTGGDGVVEFLIVDQRRGVDSLAARCEADLALFARPIVTVSYATRDLATKSGKPVVISLPSQGIAQTLTIQEVTITEIGIAKGLAPRFTVKASSVRFSLEDTLRRLIAVGPVSVNA